MDFEYSDAHGDTVRILNHDNRITISVAKKQEIKSVCEMDMPAIISLRNFLNTIIGE